VGLLSEREFDLFERLNRNLEVLSAKFDVVIKLNGMNGQSREEFCGFDAKALLDLPDHLRRTMLTLIRLGRATAEDVAAASKRARAVESGYLNQLLTMKYVKKERKGRKAFFFVDFNAYT